MLQILESGEKYVQSMLDVVMEYKSGPWPMATLWKMKHGINNIRMTLINEGHLGTQKILKQTLT